MEDKFDALIDTHKIVIFGYTNEKETQLSMELFESNGSEYTLYDLEKEEDAKDILIVLEKRYSINNIFLIYYKRRRLYWHQVDG